MSVNPGILIMGIAFVAMILMGVLIILNIVWPTPQPVPEGGPKLVFDKSGNLVFDRSVPALIGTVLATLGFSAIIAFVAAMRKTGLPFSWNTVPWFTVAFVCGCVVLSLVGLVMLLRIATLTVNPAERTYRFQIGYYPNVRSFEGTFADFDNLSFVTEMRYFRSSLMTEMMRYSRQYPVWCIDLVWRDGGRRNFRLGEGERHWKRWANIPVSEEGDRRQAYELCEELAAQLGLQIVDYTGEQPVIRNPGELGTPS